MRLFIAVTALSALALTVMATGEQGAPERARMALRELSTKAEAGDPAAMYRLATVYERGFDTIAPDSVRALKLLRSSAEAGWPAAQNLYGFRLYNGNGMPRDRKRGLDWMEKAAMAGDITAANNLGWLLLEGSANRHDAADAAFWLDKAAKGGVPQAMAMLGDLYREGKGVECDTLKALELYDAAIDAGLADAQLKLLSMENESWKRLNPDEALRLGLRYYTRRAPYLGVVLFSQAAEADPYACDSLYINHVAQAHALLGDAMTRALGADYDYDGALRHYFTAARLGNPSAQYILSELLEIFPDALQELELAEAPTADERSASYWQEKAQAAGIADAANAAKALVGY